MNNIKNVPEIRFKGCYDEDGNWIAFTHPWEQRKLGELAEIVGGGTPSTGIDSYWNGDIDWYAPAEIGEQIYLKSSQRKITEEGLNKSSAKILPIGTVLFTSRAGIGKTAILLKDGCTNQGFQSIVPNKEKLDSYFIFTRTEELKRYGETVGAGSTFVEVSGKQMANMKLMMPKTMLEQQQIGEYFQSLDHLITLHQRKVDTYEKLKKCMMQKMFSQDIRFKADDGHDFPDWEEKKLDEVFIERVERSKGGESLLSVTIAQGVVKQSETDKRNIASENKSNYKIVKKNDLAYNTMRMWQGAEGVSMYDGIVSPAYTIITALDGNNSYFFETMFKQTVMLQVFQRYSQGLTSDTWNLKFHAFSRIKCQVPCENEQNKIVDYFSSLDNVIKSQKEKVAVLKKLKKCMLHKMFV